MELIKQVPRDLQGMQVLQMTWLGLMKGRHGSELECEPSQNRTSIEQVGRCGPLKLGEELKHRSSSQPWAFSKF